MQINPGLDSILNTWRTEAAASGYSRERTSGTASEELYDAFFGIDQG